MKSMADYIAAILGPEAGEIYTLNQAYLDEEDRIPANGRLCAAICKVEGQLPYYCTKQKEHTSDHVAHESLGSIIHRWPRE